METQTTPSLKLSDELLPEILSIHAAGADREVDLKPILQIMDKILLDVDRVINGSHGGTVALKKNASLPSFDHGEEILADIHNVSGKLSCNCLGEEDAHQTTKKLLETLKTYSWNTKAVLALAAFTANLGEFCLLLQRGNTNSLASCVAFLWQVPDIESLNALRDGVSKLVRAIWNLAKRNDKFMREPHFWCFSKETSSNKEAKFEIIGATYWTIYSIVEFSRLLGWRNKNNKLITEDGRTLIIQFETQVSQIYDILKNHFKRWKEHIVKDMEDAYKSLQKLMQREGGVDIGGILGRFCGEDIYKVDIEKLRNRHVLFLISDFDISLEEIKVLNALYQKADRYEIVWLPVVDRLCGAEKLSELKTTMEWCTDVPPILEPAVIKYIKEVWHFVKNPIAVLLTPEGEVTCRNALPLLWTWGNEAFPFTADKEKTLWHKRYGWKLDFLVDDLIDPELRKWISEGKLICLYGGGSIDWIRKFTTAIKDVLAGIGVTVEMVYVGKNNAKQWTGNVTELRSHDLHFLKSERHFWARLQSLLYLYTEKRQGKTPTRDDSFMLEVMKILAYDGSGGGWALFCKGADVTVRLQGETALSIIQKYSDHREDYHKKHDFLEGLRYYMEDQNIPHSCVQLKLPFISSEVPGKVLCCECGQEMEMYYMYCCCKE